MNTRSEAPTRAVADVAGSLCAIAAALAIAGPAQAENWYAGASIGRSEEREDLVAQYFSATPGFNIAGQHSDSRDSAWKVFVGYRLAPRIALEASYLDLVSSSISAGALLANSFLGTSFGGERRASAYGLDLVGSVPIAGRFSALGRVGAARVETRLTGRGQAYRSPFLIDERDIRTVLRFGVGAQWDITRSISLRIEWERLRNTGSRLAAFPLGTGRSDIDLASVGCLLSF